MKIKFLEKILSVILFVTIFYIGIVIYSDYNVYSDETFHQWSGKLYYSYIKSLFLSNVQETSYLNEILNNINNPHQKVWFIYPMFFEIISEFINDIFKIKDVKEIYKVRHFLNFSIFFISLIFLHQIILKRYNSYFFSCLAVIAIFFSPRIFANAFYNSKDILFLSIIIITSFYAYKLIENKTFKNYILFSIFCGIAINVRIIGIYLPLLIFFIILFDDLNLKKKTFYNLKQIFISIFIISFIVIIFWPFLWLSPLKNFFIYLKWLLKEIYVIENLFLGNNVASIYVPWYYLVTWIFLTLPFSLLILSFFSLGSKFVYFLKKIINFSEDQVLLAGSNERFDFYITVSIISFIILSFGSSNFSGWRHFYFLSFYIVYLFIETLHYFQFNNKKFKIFKFLILVVILNYGIVINWIFKNHPFQYVYFNNIKKFFIKKDFDLDYFGLSEKQALEQILKKDNRNLIKIFSFGYSWLEGSKSMLESNNRKRFIVTTLEEADYVLDRNVPYMKDKKKIIDSFFFRKYYEIIVDNNSIITIYKK